MRSLRRALWPALALSALARPILAATILVNAVDGIVDPNDNSCTLPEAIAAANDDAASGPGAGECAAGSGADTVLLDIVDNVILTTEHNYTAGYNGLPVVTSEVTLEGQGFAVERHTAAPFFRFFFVDSGGRLTLRDVTLTNGDVGYFGNCGGAIYNRGSLTLVDSAVSQGQANCGGAIGNSSDLLLKNSVLSHNSATIGGALINYSGTGAAILIDSLVVHNAAGWGAGIRHENSLPIDTRPTDRITLTLIRTVVESNTAEHEGGGISAIRYSLPGGAVTLLESTVRDNTAVESGGGIHAEGAVVRLVDSTVSDNTAQLGGGIYASVQTQTDPNTEPDISLTRSLLAGNRAAKGGGIALLYGNLSLINTTLSDNGAQGDVGGGLLNSQGTAILTHATLMGNLAVSGGAGIHNESIFATTTVTRSIVGDSVGANCAGAVVDGGDNFDDDDSCPFLGVIDAADVATTLADNGGPTPTHALLPGSSAKNRAICGLITDQRGALRDLSCDSGAFEWGADDRYEYPDAGTGDDVCPGHHIQFGDVEHHLHPYDVDWVWFTPHVGATYEIETGNLHGLVADTWLELWRGCQTLVDSDDNSGVGNGDKITYVATVDDAQLGLAAAIHQLGGFYDTDKGYDVVVACVADCPPCPAGGFNVFDLFDEDIVSFRRIEACVEIWTGRTGVHEGATLVLSAGDLVKLDEGFHVAAGAELVIDTDPASGTPP